MLELENTDKDTECQWRRPWYLEGDADDDAVAGAQPEPVAGDVQRRDAHEGEAQLARAWAGEVRSGDYI